MPSDTGAVFPRMIRYISVWTYVLLRTGGIRNMVRIIYKWLASRLTGAGIPTRFSFQILSGE